MGYKYDREKLDDDLPESASLNIYNGYNPLTAVILALKIPVFLCNFRKAL